MMPAKSYLGELQPLIERLHAFRVRDEKAIEGLLANIIFCCTQDSTLKEKVVANAHTMLDLTYLLGDQAKPLAIIKVLKLLTLLAEQHSEKISQNRLMLEAIVKLLNIRSPVSGRQSDNAISIAAHAVVILNNLMQACPSCIATVAAQFNVIPWLVNLCNLDSIIAIASEAIYRLMRDNIDRAKQVAAEPTISCVLEKLFAHTEQRCRQVSLRILAQLVLIPSDNGLPVLVVTFFLIGKVITLLNVRSSVGTRKKMLLPERKVYGPKVKFFPV